MLRHGPTLIIIIIIIIILIITTTTTKAIFIKTDTNNSITILY
jgi:hypothetical protein